MDKGLISMIYCGAKVLPFCPICQIFLRESDFGRTIFCLIYAPRGQGKCAFHLFLYVIGEIAEEVDARLTFQFVDTDGILFESSIGVGLMLHPEGYGLVASTSVLGILAEKSHEEVFGNRQRTSLTTA